ncbi:transposase [Catalinimonas alkaloidigena]|uniref:IS66 family insertion sequence element accessory protein TnpB n=1 Tax=Catalinimonas alkaloidigena TaxID=1075417 RepID=UPI0024062E7D|nr:IS66 family insertion sequence element accessory protein TnpB [Catalinimonas alkaloidigena]MDF9799227.1 transposase [Catalinimonas alkaloidigena]
MFGLSQRQQFFLFSQAVDMRKGFDGLSGIVQQQMGRDVCSGDVYIFLGKRLDRMKLLVWESSGFVLYYKRLEAGTFKLPKVQDHSISLTYSELSLLLEGLEVEVKYRRKRYSKTFEKV